MKGKYARFVIRKHRAQLHITEVIFSATVILLLAVSIGQTQLYLVNTSESDSEQYQDTADGILRNSDELGYLRPYIYLDQEQNLQLYLDIEISSGIFYWLYSRDSPTVYLSNHPTLAPLNFDSYFQEYYQASLFLSGYADSNGSQSTSYVTSHEVVLVLAPLV